MKNALVTGAKGFLGSNVVKNLEKKGYNTYGIGHGVISPQKCREMGLKYWKESSVNIKSILDFDQTFDVIVHCAGNGSVGFSMDNPYEDFKKTSQSSIEVLEYMRLYNPGAHLIFSSSPAVQGECEDIPIKENYIGKPVSPYGYHKKIVEALCQSYNENFNLRISIIRFFSIYGNGLKKQLLWDASKKIKNETKETIFFGTGEETRDFIHISDALNLINILLESKKKFIIINGGTGIKHTVKNIISIIHNLINPDVEIKFNNQKNNGNPKYYCANTEKLENYGFKANVKLYQGIKDYVNWIKTLDD